MICNNNYCDIKESFTSLLKGDPGKKGPPGVIGSTGDVGLRGLDGPIGPQGPRGDTGIRGLSGFKGDRGEQGERGITGRRGDKGNVGVQGPRGDKGPKGWKGVRGLQLERADPGPPGIQGPPGSKGESGRQFSILTVSNDEEKMCYWQENTEIYPSMMGDRSREKNYCFPGYALSGIKTSAWSNNVEAYVEKCKPRYMKPPKCWTTHDKHIGNQMMRDYSMKCCPTILPKTWFNSGNLNTEGRGDNLDDYKNYDSVRKYPFHKP